MSKFYGKIGFVTEASESEEQPGVWETEEVEKTYSGDVLKNVYKNQISESINSNVTLNAKISILIDPFLNNHIHSIKYVEYIGQKWQAVKLDVDYPRLVITLGGLYNEQA